MATQETEERRAIEALASQMTGTWREVGDGARLDAKIETLLKAVDQLMDRVAVLEKSLDVLCIHLGKTL